MKFWNKRKEVRLRCWTCVKLRCKDLHPFFSGNFMGFTTHSEFIKFKRDLQLNPSKNRFYMNIMHREIWFEDNKDAVWFSLTHSDLLR